MSSHRTWKGSAEYRNAQGSAAHRCVVSKRRAFNASLACLERLFGFALPAARASPPGAEGPVRLWINAGRFLQLFNSVDDLGINLIMLCSRRTARPQASVWTVLALMAF